VLSQDLANFEICQSISNRDELADVSLEEGQSYEAMFNDFVPDGDDFPLR